MSNLGTDKIGIQSKYNGPHFVHSGTFVLEDGKCKSVDSADSDSGFESRESTPSKLDKLKKRQTMDICGLGKPLIGPAMPPSRILAVRKRLLTADIEDKLDQVSLMVSRSTISEGADKDKVISPVSSPPSKKANIQIRLSRHEKWNRSFTNSISSINPDMSKSIYPTFSSLDYTPENYDIFKSQAKIGQFFKIRNLRKRTLSERAVKQAQFPVVEKNIVKTSFEGCKFINENVERGVGLTNRSNFCFMNSVLQCIAHLPQLARLIVDYHQKKQCLVTMNNKKCFWCCLKNHIIRAMTFKDAFEPNQLKYFLENIFGRSFEGDQEDAHEFFSLLLDTLEKVYPSSNLVEGNLTLSQEPSNPIEQVLSGTMRNEIHCPNCHSMKVNYERYRELNINLPSIILKKNQHPTMTITRLFDEFFEPEELDGYKCEECKTTVTAIKKSILLRAPHVLLIQLKRFNFYGVKIRTCLSTEMEINLQPHMYNSNIPMKYKLQSYIEHHGSNIAYGHYTTVCRDVKGNRFNFYDDHSVYELNDRAMEKMNPYVLIYTLISPNESSLATPVIGTKRPNDKVIKNLKVKIPRIEFLTTTPPIPQSNNSTNKCEESSKANKEFKNSKKRYRNQSKSSDSLNGPHKRNDFKIRKKCFNHKY
uniref:USP domain-containing protein n=1 Tax=Rhabditophanes sp. KR3021 TaxID=114890 RepID=A0AC35TP75_9BILA